MKMGKIYSFLIILFLSIMLIPSIFAIPGFPHEFCGDVLVNDLPAPDGTLISAEITGKTVIANIQNPVETLNGNYGKEGSSLLVQGEDLEDSIVRFFVNGVYADKTFSYFAYGGGPDCVNLSVGKQADGEPCSVNDYCTSGYCLNSVCTPVTSTEAPTGGGPSGGGISSTTSIISVNELLQGVSKDLNVDDKLTMSIGGENHAVRLTRLTSTTATIIITSTPQTKTLNIGEELKVNVNDDEYFDLLIKLNSISLSKANISLKAINELISSPSDVIGAGETEPASDITTEEKESDFTLMTILITIVLVIVLIGVAYWVIYRKKIFRKKNRKGGKRTSRKNIS